MMLSYWRIAHSFGSPFGRCSRTTWTELHNPSISPFEDA
ncbi:hypothetical protein H5410_008873 [Solanum commersonii]|uniref:Uncharacterized protein n=1 Tax=Solanum commersonii TaxID=4109 RepID=A0A9J6AI10_SOLCO|nr:hypothetical protein H5410_008873 [Solanum commersonii]